MSSFSHCRSRDELKFYAEIGYWPNKECGPAITCKMMFIGRMAVAARGRKTHVKETKELTSADAAPNNQTKQPLRTGLLTHELRGDHFFPRLH